MKYVYFVEKYNIRKFEVIKETPKTITVHYNIIPNDNAQWQKTFIGKTMFFNDFEKAKETLINEIRFEIGYQQKRIERLNKQIMGIVTMKSEDVK